MYKATDKTKKALAKGRSKVWTAEMREKLRVANTGKKITEKQKQALSKGRAKSYWKGKKRPEMSGENNPEWKGGRISLKNKIRKLPEYNEWRLAIFKRDGFKCVLCGSTGRLQVDHYPKTFASIIKEKGINSMDDALKCGELWNKKDNRTLCLECHKKTPTYLRRIG